MPGIRKTIVVAVSQNGIIGRDGDMPWRLSTDLKRFKTLTIGKPLVVGRKTYQSFGNKPLPGRPHVVVSRSAQIEHPDVTMAQSLAQAIGLAESLAREQGGDEIIIAGGGEVYAQAMAIVDRLCVTYVETHVEGDTSFPDIDNALWKVVEAIDVPAGEKDNYPTRFVIYDRR